jgi:hypothetical protein
MILTLVSYNARSFSVPGATKCAQLKMVQLRVGSVRKQRSSTTLLNQSSFPDSLSLILKQTIGNLMSRRRSETQENRWVLMNALENIECSYLACHNLSNVGLKTIPDFQATSHKRETQISLKFNGELIISS